jgi:hypothetical protein
MMVIHITPAVPPLNKPKYAELESVNTQVTRSQGSWYVQKRTLPCRLKHDNETNDGDHAKVSLRGVSNSNTCKILFSTYS